MLKELRIGHLGLVEELDLILSGGLCVLTGETGAGKSMIAGAFAILAGRKAPRELVRDGDRNAWVEGVFDLGDRPQSVALLAEMGLPLGEDASLVLRREISREGRGRVLINGRLSSLAVLERIGARLLSVQSQNQQTELADPDYPRRVLDDLLELGDLRTGMRGAWTEWRRYAGELADTEADMSAAAEQLDIWTYQLRELEAAQLDVDEEASIREDLATVRHAEQIRAATAAAYDALDGGDSAARSALGRSVTALDRVAGVSARLDAVLGVLKESETLLDEAALDLERFSDDFSADPAQLDALETRLALYEDLQRKYKQDIPGLLVYKDLLASRLAKQDNADDHRRDLQAKLEEAAGRLREAAGALRERRRAGAVAVARLAQDVVRPLALPDLELEFRVTDRRSGPRLSIDGRECGISADGADDVELLLRTNRGEGIGLVADIASGGEKSRLYMGLTSMLQDVDEPPLLLLDEIDSGLGNDAALPVARLLRSLAQKGQVLCITHLPTMAAHGHTHWRVSKTSDGTRTILELERLEAEARTREVARLLGGTEAGSGDPEIQLRYARELLASHGV